MSVESDSSEGAFGKALRLHGGEAGREMALAFREHELGLSQRLADLKLDLRETIVDQGAAARQARWISAVTLAIVLGIGGGGIVLFKDIGRLEVKADNLATGLTALNNRVDALQADMEQVLDTIRAIDERTREMASRAELEPATERGNPEESSQGTQLLVESDNTNPEEAASSGFAPPYIGTTQGHASPLIRPQGGVSFHFRTLEGLASTEARQFAQRITEIGFVARPVAEALVDTGLSYEQVFSDWGLASQAISNASVGRTLVTLGDLPDAATRIRQNCRIPEDSTNRLFAVAVEEAGGEVVCLDYLNILPMDLLADGIIVDFDLWPADLTRE